MLKENNEYENDRNKIRLYEYITVNQNNKFKNQKAIFKTVNNNSTNDKFVNYKKVNVKNKVKNGSLFKHKIKNNKLMKKNLNISFNKKTYNINNKNSLDENINEFYYNTEENLNKIKTTNINKNIHKNKSSNTINNSPYKFYHNIIDIKKSHHYIKIRNSDDYKKENIINNYFTENVTKRENDEIKSKKIDKKKNYYYRGNNKDKSFSKIEKDLNINSTCYFKTEEKTYNHESKNKSISFNYNKKSFTEAMKKIENKIFKVNKLLKRDNLSKNLNIQYLDEESQKNKIRNHAKRYSHQNNEEENNNHNLYKKIKYPKNNKSKHVLRINSENKKNIKYNDNIIIHCNIEDLDKNYEINNIDNSDNYHYRPSFYNLYIPKTSTLNNINENNSLLNNFNEIGSILFSKGTYNNYNTISDMKKNKTRSNTQILPKNISYSFNKENIHNINLNYKSPQNNQSIIFNPKNKAITKDYCYTKKNSKKLIDNKKILDLNEINSMKYINNISPFNHNERFLFSLSQKRKKKKL